jgi:putative oxidoreductase
MVGAILLILGRFVPWVAAGYILILSAGIALVHAREGWFVVGAGRNGVEYSLLLIACLSSLILGRLRSQR